MSAIHFKIFLRLVSRHTHSTVGSIVKVCYDVIYAMTFSTKQISPLLHGGHRKSPILSSWVIKCNGWALSFLGVIKDVCPLSWGGGGKQNRSEKPFFELAIRYFKFALSPLYSQVIGSCHLYPPPPPALVIYSGNWNGEHFSEKIPCFIAACNMES